MMQEIWDAYCWIVDEEVQNAEIVMINTGRAASDKVDDADASFSNNWQETEIPLYLSFQGNKDLVH